VLVEPAYGKTCLLHQFCDSPQQGLPRETSWKRSKPCAYESLPFSALEWPMHPSPEK
jgi:hypothetical protein